jgi:hypothetical protein
MINMIKKLSNVVFYTLVAFGAIVSFDLSLELMTKPDTFSFGAGVFILILLTTFTIHMAVEAFSKTFSKWIKSFKQSKTNK